jgi:hypothetical protein
MLAVVSNALSTTLHCAETMYQQFLCSFTAMTHVQLVSCLRVSCLDRSFSVLIYSNKQRWWNTFEKQILYIRDSQTFPLQGTLNCWFFQHIHLLLS